MEIGSVLSGFGNELVGQFLRSQPEPKLPDDIEELEDELHRLKLKIRSVEEEGILPPRRLVYVGAALVAGILIYAWLIKS